MSADTRKLILMLSGIVGAVVLAVTGQISGHEALITIGTLTGYGIGNGYNTLRGRVSTPVFVPRELPPPNINERKGPE